MTNYAKQAAIAIAVPVALLAAVPEGAIAAVFRLEEATMNLSHLPQGSEVGVSFAKM